MKIPKLLFVICVILFSSSLIYSQSKNSQIQKLVGKWRSIKVDQKGVEIKIQFNSDGTAKYDVSTVLNGNYILNGNKLISYFKKFGTNNVVVDTSIIEFKGNYLIQKSLVGGTTIKMTRLDKKNNKNKLLLGKWISENYNGYKAITEFNAYYGLNVHLLVKSIKGSYFVNKNMITIFSPTTYRFRLNFKIDKNIMTLHNLENGKDLTMVRLAK